MSKQTEEIVDGYIEDLNENYIYVVLLDDDGDPYGEVKFKNNPMYRAINPIVGKLLRIRIDTNNYASIALSTMDGYPVIKNESVTDSAFNIESFYQPMSIFSDAIAAAAIVAAAAADDAAADDDDAGLAAIKNRRREERVRYKY